ncbi:MAG: hypothetical protein H6719_20025 [Sandaracinaceae bacterium]|nr:hypothetical protein [Sandaracinaceae bacterium]
MHTLPFPDRAPVVTAFRVQRDAGAEVRIAPREAPVEAIVRVGNGSGSILGNDTPIPAGYASADLVLGRAWSGASASDRGWGLRLGAAGMIESVRDRNGVAGTAPLGFVYYRPTIVSGERLVGEAHAITYLDTVRLTFEGALAQESRSRDDDGNPSTPRVALDPIRSSGLTAELAWVALGGARAPGFAPTLAPGSSGAWAGGALEVAVRFDALWLGWGAADVTEGGALAGGASVRWWPVDFVTVTLAGHVTRYATPPIETPQEIWSWDALLRLGVFWGLGAVNG